MALSINNLLFPIESNDESSIRNRVKLSACAKLAKTERTFRPKSSPIKLNQSGLESFYLSKRNAVESTVSENFPLSMSPLFSCDRSLKSQIEHVKAYRFPSASGKRPFYSAKSQNKMQDTFSKPFNLGPGYVIYKNESDFTIQINSDEFFGSRKNSERLAATKNHVQDHKDILINNLEEQISNLTVYLEEEKLNHNLSLIKYEGQLEVTRKTLEENYKVETENLKEDFEKVLKAARQEHAEYLENQKEEFDEKLNQCERELHTFKASFESYRQSLMKETSEKFEAEKNQMSNDYDIQLKEALEKQNQESKYHFDVELEDLKQKHIHEINQNDSRHKSELEALNRKFSGTVAMEEKLNQTNQELEKLKKENQKLKSEYDTLNQVYSKSQKEFTIALSENERLKFDVQEFNEKFEERVEIVGDGYRRIIDAVQNEIVEIRRAYMAKCEELIEERKRIDIVLQNRIESAKDVMKELIHTRQRARISLVSQDNEFNLDMSNNGHGCFSSELQIRQNTLSHQSSSLNLSSLSFRPVSAPTTDQEERMVKQQSSVVNLSQL